MCSRRRSRRGRALSGGCPGTGLRVAPWSWANQSAVFNSSQSSTNSPSHAPDVDAARHDTLAGWYAGFYEDVVGPLVARWPHAAARLGSGSEVLGFDSERSTDHGWGPQLVVFVDDESVAAVNVAVNDGLPEAFRGWPIRYGWDDIPVDHHVAVTTLAAWLVGMLGVDASTGFSTIDWLLTPQQKLLEVTAGAVYHDDTAQLHRVRQVLAWYPDDVWLWMVAAQWRRVAQEEAFVGRMAEAGDDLGSRLVTARLARELMRLWFLFTRSYWPYTKWFGTAFTRLPGSKPLAEALQAALTAAHYRDREAALVKAYELVGRRHNDLGITDAVDPSPRPFYNRPYQVLRADRFVDACVAELTDTELRNLALVGSVDQVADSTDVLSIAERARRLADLYR